MPEILKTIFFMIIISIFVHVSPSQGFIINGDFNSGLYGWNKSKDGDVDIENGAAILRTGGIDGLWDTSLSTDFIVSGDRVTFRYYFDVIGYDDIIYGDYPLFPFDSFQVSVDSDDEKYFVDPIPLAWQPAGIFIPFSIDISSIEPGTTATLTFILLDQDDGYFSIAAIDDVVNNHG